jgi:ATP phosphoribosyltransferase
MSDTLRAPPFPNLLARPDARRAARKPRADRPDATPASTKIVLALPKGRILSEVMPLLARAGIEPEPAFADEDSRKLQFRTNLPDLEIVRVRSFDVPTFVAFNAAQLGIAGNDVLMEFNYP